MLHGPGKDGRLEECAPVEGLGRHTATGSPWRRSGRGCRAAERLSAERPSAEAPPTAAAAAGGCPPGTPGPGSLRCSGSTSAAAGSGTTAAPAAFRRPAHLQRPGCHGCCSIRLRVACRGENKTLNPNNERALDAVVQEADF